MDPTPRGPLAHRMLWFSPSQPSEALSSTVIELSNAK
jgi:hypothetical protein